MHFNLTEEQCLIRQAAEGLARDYGSSQQVRAAMASAQGYDEETWTSLCELGLPSLLMPADFSGQGLGAVEMVLVFEALGAKLLPTPLLATGVLSASVFSRLARPKVREIAALIASNKFGRAIGSFQAVKHQLADVMVGVEAARSAVYYAAASVSDNPMSLPTMAALAKLEASEALTYAAGRMIQLHGGIGFTWEHDAHLYFKRARGAATLFGANAALDERIAHHIGLDDAA